MGGDTSAECADDLYTEAPARVGETLRETGEAGATREALLRAIHEADADALRALDLRGASLRECDLTGADLTRVDLSGADLTRARLAGARLAEANLFETCLDEAELVGSDLSGANLSRCTARRAAFGGAHLRGSRLFEADLEGASLSRADLAESDLRCAILRGAHVHDASLEGADASRCDLRSAQLDRTRVEGATFDRADLRETSLAEIVGFEKASWIGVDDRDTDFRGAYTLRRQIVDENYLHEFRSRGRGNAALYWMWWATSDCGRSFLRWALWTVLVVVIFAGVFDFVSIDYGDHPTFLSSIYFSVVTLTTLGYGDVVPASPAAQLVVMTEVVLGYVALGGLISILANKMARRGE